jgi:hypothetical protein
VGHRVDCSNPHVARDDIFVPDDRRVIPAVNQKGQAMVKTFESAASLFDELKPEIDRLQRRVVQLEAALAQANRRIAELSKPIVVTTLPNGREIRFQGGKFSVQPLNDNYWLSVDTLDEAIDACDNPEKYRQE